MNLLPGVYKIVSGSSMEIVTVSSTAGGTHAIRLFSVHSVGITGSTANLTFYDGRSSTMLTVNGVAGQGVLANINGGMVFHDGCTVVTDTNLLYGTVVYTEEL